MFENVFLSLPQISLTALQGSDSRLKDFFSFITLSMLFYYFLLVWFHIGDLWFLCYFPCVWGFLTLCFKYSLSLVLALWVKCILLCLCLFCLVSLGLFNLGRRLPPEGGAILSYYLFYQLFYCFSFPPSSCIINLKLFFLLLFIKYHSFSSLFFIYFIISASLYFVNKVLCIQNSVALSWYCIL